MLHSLRDRRYIIITSLCELITKNLIKMSDDILTAIHMINTSNVYMPLHTMETVLKSMTLAFPRH